MGSEYRYKRYGAGMGIIFLQYIFFVSYSKNFNMDKDMNNLIFFIYIFLYLKEDIYSFTTCLIWEELKKHLKCFLEFIIIISLIIYYMMGIEKIMEYLILGTLVFIYTLFLIKVFRKVFYSQMKSNLLIVGAGKNAKELSLIIDKNKFTMYNILGYLEMKEIYGEVREIPADKIIKDLKELEIINKKNKIDEIIIALPELTDKEMNEVVKKIEKYGERIKFIPRINKMYTFDPRVQDYDGVLLIDIKNKIFSKKRRIIKRGLDIVGSLVGMGILYSLYFIYGKKIKKDGGPILYAHKRVGQNLKIFEMYKFRSMYLDAEKRLEELLAENEELKIEFYTNFKLKNDPRVTPVGKILRRTSLDEFPQFINVLKGNMSLVGPRPVVQKEVEMYYGTENGEKVFQVKPGITGMWQANGRSDVEDYDERIALDLYYIRNWCLWLDIIILIKTVKNVISRKGAY